MVNVMGTEWKCNGHVSTTILEIVPRRESMGTRLYTPALLLYYCYKLHPLYNHGISTNTSKRFFLGMIISA